jgi:hypothetical protein
MRPSAKVVCRLANVSRRLMVPGAGGDWELIGRAGKDTSSVTVAKGRESGLPEAILVGLLSALLRPSWYVSWTAGASTRKVPG